MQSRYLYLVIFKIISTVEQQCYRVNELCETLLKNLIIIKFFDAFFSALFSPHPITFCVLSCPHALLVQLNSVLHMPLNNSSMICGFVISVHRCVCMCLFCTISSVSHADTPLENCTVTHTHTHKPQEGLVSVHILCCSIYRKHTKKSLSLKHNTVFKNMLTWTHRLHCTQRSCQKRKMISLFCAVMVMLSQDHIGELKSTAYCFPGYK